MKKINVIVVFKTHFDIGFTELAEEIIARYGSDMMDSVLNVCEKTRDNAEGRKFVWTMSAWPLLQSLNKTTPSRYGRAVRLLHDGQLVAHALPYTTHTEFMGFEELCRSFAYSKEVCNRFGMTYPVSAKMTDVPGHTWFMPSLLAQAGVKFLHLGCNSASRPPRVPLLFWWEGADGARVLTMYNTTYGSAVLPDKNWKYPVWLAMCQTNDNIGPQSDTVIEELERTFSESGIEANFSIGTMDDFWYAIEECDLSDLPVIHGDLADSWIHGVGTYPAEVSRLRRLRPKLAALESYLSVNRLMTEEIRNRISAAYENMQLFGEHTWGLDVKTTLGYGRKYAKSEFEEWRKNDKAKRMELSWDEQRARIVKAEEICDKIYSDLSDGRGGAFYNSLARPFSEYTEVPSGTPDSFEACGRTYARVSVDALSLTVAQTAVQPSPECGFIDDGNSFVWENKQLRVKIDKSSGGLCELFHKATGKNWVCGSGEYYYDVIGMQRIWQYIRKYCSRYFDWSVNDFGRMDYPDHAVDKTFKCKALCSEIEGRGVRVEFCPKDTASVTEYGNAEKITVDYIPLGDRLHVVLNIVNKSETPFVESGNFRFLLNTDGNVTYRVNKVGNVLDPSKDIVPDANHNIYCLENWIDVCEEERGLMLVSYDAPLFSFERDNVYRADRKFRKPKRADIHFNLFNNMWGTNFPQWLGGDFKYEFDLIPHGADSSEAERKAYALVHSPIILDTDQSFAAQLNVKNAELSSVCDCGNRILVRVRETTGNHVTVRLSGELLKGKAFELVDLYQRSVGSEGLRLKDDVLIFHLPANGFATVAITK